MEFLINTNTFTYILKKSGNDIILNGKDINLDMKYIENDEKKDITDVYNMLIADGHNANYAAAKATLYFADYIELGESATIEFMDILVLYLAGIVKIPNKIHEKYKRIVIDITDTHIKSDKAIIEFNPHQSSIIPFSYKKLLNALLYYYQN